VATTIHSPSHPPIAISPGDWLHGDVDGVVVIPGCLVSKVYDVALRLKEVDEQVAREIDGGMDVAEAFARWRQGGKAR
jgi:regulator of RNase E activity RraA